MRKLVMCLCVAAWFLSACSTSRQMVTEKTDVVNLDTLIIHATPQPVVYKGSKKRINDLLHTKLEVSFDWDSTWLKGRAVIDVQPYQLPVSTLVLDAKGFEIHEVMVGKKDSLQKTTYVYEADQLTIDLGHTYHKGEVYRVAVSYTAKPNERKTKAGTAIQSDKGLYFIQSDLENKKTWQIWTQGETSASSAWFPTIDAPNERMTQEIYITVDTIYETLSNGLMLFETDNRDGTKTAYWKMDLPHAPYLTMMAVGDFAIVHDQWQNLEVNYYVDRKFEKTARRIFGNTPEMLEFYSNRLGVKFPWSKYSQVVVKEYVSGAMENTTAVIHGDFIQQTPREMIDNDFEDFIAHELFHHWFGDLVTCESWANLPLNESFATYGEYLWLEHKYGKDAADYHLHKDLKAYLSAARSGGAKKMIRYDYQEEDDLFDQHSYQKGGRILHLLRTYIGDELFFQSLKTYLDTFQFQSVEIHQLRQVVEKVTGEDLTWFFDQWFFTAGHPELSFQWTYIDSLKQIKVVVEQTQDFKKTPLYRLPLAIDIYEGTEKQRKEVVIHKAEETLFFNVAAKPKLVNFDANKVLIGRKNDQKSTEEWKFMYQNAPLFLDRFEAISALEGQKDTAAVEVLLSALEDPFWKIRSTAIQGLSNAIQSKSFDPKEKLMWSSQNDQNSLVRAQAIDVLANFYEDENLVGLYIGAIQDSSYEVVSSALMALVAKDEAKGMVIANTMEAETNKKIIRTISDLYARKGNAAQNAYFLKMNGKTKGFDRYSFILSYATYLERQNDSIVSLGVDLLEEFVKAETTWWVRIAGVNAIKDLQKKYREQTTVNAQRVESLKEDNPNKSIYLQMLNSNNRLLDQINALVEGLIETEKNEQILKVLKG